MTKTLCPAGCGKRYISEEHAICHADLDQPDWRTPKARGWTTPYGFVDFGEKVTYAHACEVAKQIQEKYVGRGRMISPRLCPKCRKNEAEVSHVCPYQKDVNNDEEYECECCEECEERCADDI